MKTVQTINTFEVHKNACEYIYLIMSKLKKNNFFVKLGLD